MSFLFLITETELKLLHIIRVVFLDELGKFLSLALFTPQDLDNSVQV